MRVQLILELDIEDVYDFNEAEKIARDFVGKCFQTNLVSDKDHLIVYNDLRTYAIVDGDAL